jgi:hypothetical protein
VARSLALASGGELVPEKGAAPAGGESGRRAYGPALGGEAGSVLMEAYPYAARESSLIPHVAIILEHIWPGREHICRDALLLSSSFSHYENIGPGARLAVTTDAIRRTGGMDRPACLECAKEVYSGALVIGGS